MKVRGAADGTLESAPVLGLLVVLSDSEHDECTHICIYNLCKALEARQVGLQPAHPGPWVFLGLVNGNPRRKRLQLATKLVQRGIFGSGFRVAGRQLLQCRGYSQPVQNDNAVDLVDLAGNPAVQDQRHHKVLNLAG